MIIDVDLSQLSYLSPLRCVLSGEPIDRPYPVALRRMYFLVGFWIGESAIMPFPAKAVSYTKLQYLRCFGWMTVLFTPIPIVANLELSLDHQWVKQAIFLLIAAATGLGIFLVLKREKIRLLRVGKDRSRLRVKINDDIWKLLEPQISSGVTKSTL